MTDKPDTPPRPKPVRFDGPPKYIDGAYWAWFAVLFIIIFGFAEWPF